MIFQKPKNQKFVDVAIDFDFNFWKVSEQESSNYFKDIYIILYMLASINKYFKTFKDYDEFAYVSATTLFIRFLNKKKRVYKDVNDIIDGTYFTSFNSNKVRKNLKNAFIKKENNQPNLFDMFGMTPTSSIADIEECASKVVDLYKTHKITYFELVMMLNNTGVLTDFFVKSLLNYCKGCVYQLKITYQNDTFKQVYNTEYDDINEISSLENYQKTQIQRDYSNEVLFNFIEQFKDIVFIAKDIINKSPFKKGTCLHKNVYMSLLLSFINSITLTNNDYDKLVKKLDKHQDVSQQLAKYFKKESISKPILWHLNDSYEDYIKYLLRVLKERLVKEFKDTHNYLELTDDVLNDILTTAYSVTGVENNEITN